MSEGKEAGLKTPRERATDFGGAWQPGAVAGFPSSGTPLWPFDYGLSLTEFEFGCQKGAGATASSTLCSVQNKGALRGDAVPMVASFLGSWEMVFG